MFKKRLASLLTSAAMLISMVTVFPATVSAAPTELFNDGFEDGSLCGWTPRNATLTLSSDQAYSGTSSLFISDRTVNWHGAGCKKELELRAGGTYELSGWFYYDAADAGSSESMSLNYLYKDTSGTERYVTVATASVNKGEWKQITNSSVTIPEGATGVTIYAQASNASLSFYIDNIAAVGEPAEASGEDGFSNDFEDNTLQGWSARGSETVNVVSTYAHSGSYSIYTTDRAQLWNGPGASKTLVLQPGGYYEFTAYVMYNGASWTDTAGWQLYMQYDADGKTNYKDLAAGKTAKGEWLELTGRFTIPENASGLVVYVQPQYTSSPTDQDNTIDFYVDDVSGTRLADPSIQTDIPSLYEAYSDYFKIGCASTATELAQGATKDLILKHYNSLTFGNELKPDAVLNQTACQNLGSETEVAVSLASAKTLLEFASENNIPVRGHCLVWHSQTPDWFFKVGYSDSGAWVTKEVMLQRMENYIKNLMSALATQYPNVNFYCWDVVNEAVEASNSNGLRTPGSNNVTNGQSAWMQTIGEDFIEYAFTYARQYAPAGCKLFYNDYNEYDSAKRAYIYSICEDLAAKNLIDGVGMQSHIKMSYPTVSVYEETIRKYNELGLEIQVTELDVDQQSNSSAAQLELAERYRSIMQCLKDCYDDGCNITAVVLWGITDVTSWIGGYPLLFDKDYQAKPSFYAVLDTEADIQTIKTVKAISYDGTASGLEEAFAVQADNAIGSVGSYKLAWNDSRLIVRVTAKTAGAVTIMTESASSTGTSLSAGQTKDFTIALESTGLDTSFGFDVAIGSTAWNSISYDGRTSGFDTASFGNAVLSDFPKYAEAQNGSPTVDGEIDAVWSQVDAINVNTYTLGNGAHATSKAMWDSQNVYFLVEVTDSSLNQSSGNAYEQDTVEIFFDENNNKTNIYQNDDIQCRISYNNDKTVSDNKSINDYTSATTITSNGYIVEVSIPYSISAYKANQIVGYDVQINDDDGSGKRAGMANWSDLTGMGYTSTTNFGVLKLVGEASDTLLGDVNLDGVINVIDVAILAKRAANLITLSAEAEINGDTTGDGTIDVRDVAKLAKMAVGLL